MRPGPRQHQFCGANDECGPRVYSARLCLGCRVAAAGGIALINSIGSLAGFGGPYLIGWVKELTGSTITGLLVLAILPVVAALLVLSLGHDTKTEFAGEAKEI